MSLDIQTLIQLLTQDAKLDLFEMDVSQIVQTTDPSNIFRFHAGTNALLQDVTWQGNDYAYIPATMDGFDVSTQGTLPRPRLVMSNVYSAVSAIIETIGGDITGAKVTRKQTYARYLDAANFPPRTNLINYTEDATHWVWSNLTAGTSSSVADARGDLKAVALTETANAGLKGVATSTVSALASGQYVTAWVEIKPGTRTQAEITLTGPFAASAVLDVDLVGRGRVLSSSGCTRYSLQPIGDSGWFLLMVCTTANAASVATLTVRPLQAGASSYTGNTANTFYVGRSNVFTPAAAENTSDPRNLVMTVPYQYIGSSYNPNPDTDPTRYLPDEVFFVERKVTEDEVSVEFELASAIDLEDLQLPRRVITVNLCSWDEYMGEGCMYVPTAAGSGGYFDANDNPVSDAAHDVCSRSVNGCKIRQGQHSQLTFGGFPGAKAYSY